MAVDVGSAVGYLDLDISGFLAGLKTAQSEADKQSKNIVTKIGGNIESAGKKLSSVGSTLTKNVTVPIVGAGAAIVTLSSNFESAMSKVSAISGATGGDLDKLNAKAQEMGAKTKFSATEAAEAFTYMAMAGWDTESMLQGIDGIMNLAAADGLDLATTSDIVTDALTAFGLSASDSAHFADVLAKASSSANTNVSMLGESFKYVAPVAGALGYSAEDTAIALGLMANAGIKGSQSGTVLRAAITRMIKPTDKAAILMEKYGLSMTNSDGSMKSLSEVMTMLRTNLGDLTEAEQAQVAATIFGQEAMSGMLSIINASDKDFDNLTNQIYNADGAAKQMSETMLNNLSGQITILKSALEGLALQFGEIILPYIKQFVEWLQNLVQKLQELSPEQKEQIVKWAAIAAAIGPVLLILGKLVTSIGGTITTFGKIPGAIKTVTGGFSKLVTSSKNVFEGFKLAKAGFTSLGAQASPLGAAIGGITAPIAAVIAIIAVLAAAFVSLWKNNEEFRNKITAIWDGIKSKFESFAQGIVDRLNALGFDFSSIIDILKSVWEGFCNFLAPIFEGAFSIISSVLGVVLDVITGLLDVFIGLFTGNWEQLWNGVKEIFNGIWNGIVGIFKAIGDTLIGILDVVCGWFGTTWSDTWNAIKEFFVNIWNAIVTWFKGTLNGIKTFFQNLWNGIKTWFNNTLNAIKTTFTNIWNGIKTFFTNLLNGIKTTVTTVWNGIKTTITNVINGIKTTITNVFNAIKTTITNVFNGIKSTATTVWNSIKSAITSPIETAKNTISTVVNGIKTTVSNVFDGLKATVTTVWNGIKSAITTPIETAKKTVENVVKKIKEAFDFDWSLPKIKLPHFHVSGGKAPWGFGGMGSLPTVSVEWYKKAMNNGMILDSATIFGVDNKTGKLLGGGEAGSETVVGTKNLLNMIKGAVVGAIGPLVKASRELAKVTAEFGYIAYNGFTKIKEIVEEQNGTGKDDNGDGDTFVFYSPKAIDEIEAAKQMKKAKRELAEGF